MSIVDEYISVAMIRDDLEHIPQFRLPSGYSIRWYQDGDFAKTLEGLQRLPSDKVTQLYQAECRRMIDAPPESDWQGLISLA